MIFSRGRRGRHSRDDDDRPTGRHSAPEAQESPEDEEPTSLGPYDMTEAPAGVERIDLGALQIPSVDGVEVRVQASQDGAVQQVVLVHGDSALQLGVFAAPRSSGIWDEIRAELRGSLANAQGVQEVDGAYGTELRARVRTPDGPVDLRFLGVDGPRWMLQALFQGRAAVDPDAAAPLMECLEGLVVNRGKEAMPVRDPLPLRLPRDVAEQAAQVSDAPALPQPVPTAGPATPGGVNGRPARGGTRRKPSPRRST